MSMTPKVRDILTGFVPEENLSGVDSAVLDEESDIVYWQEWETGGLVGFSTDKHVAVLTRQYLIFAHPDDDAVTLMPIDDISHIGVEKAENDGQFMCAVRDSDDGTKTERVDSIPGSVAVDLENRVNEMIRAQAA
jgi:hypothetical protein